MIFLAEVVGGLWTGSLALLADAAHVFMDAFALGLSYLALRAHVLLVDQALSKTADVMTALKQTLREQFDIEHTTIQFECTACGQGVCLPAMKTPQF